MNLANARTIACSLLAGVLSAGGLGGCLKRTISITTEPDGALVWLNDVEVGRTPLETDFTFYGTYDVRIRREGYEPLATSAKASAPPHEWPGADLVSEAIPARLHNVVRWHWVLTPRIEAAMDKASAEAEVLSRARELRSRSVPATGAPAPEATTPSGVEPAPAGEAPPASR